MHCGPLAFALSHGAVYERLYAALPRWAGLALAAAGAGYWLWFGALRPQAERWWRWGQLPAQGGCIWLGFGALALVTLAGFDGASFRAGFFRQDDFAFLQDIRDVPRLGQQLWLLHNDHILPLYRLEVWTLARLAGPLATSARLAAWFNAANLVTCWLYLLAGGWLLFELGVSRLIFLGAAFVPLIWPGWGEFTAGYYTLSIYVQVAALGFAASAGVVRAWSNRSFGWLALALLAMLIATALDSSGLSAFLFTGAVAWATMKRAGDWNRRKPVWALGVVAFACAAGLFLGLGKKAAIARELVQNPHGASVSPHQMTREIVERWPQVLLTGVSAGGGLMLSLALPSYLPTMAANPSHQTLRFNVVWQLVEGLLLAGVVAVGVRRRRSWSVADRRLLMALGANAYLGVGLVLLARTRLATENPVALWNAKYLLLPVGWLQLLVLVGIGRSWARAPAAGRRVLGQAWFWLAGGVGLTLFLAATEQTLLPGQRAYVPRGRWGNRANAEARTRDFQAVMRDLKGLAATEGQPVVLLPPPDSWQGTFFVRYTSLEWGADFQPAGVTHLFWDMTAAAPNLALTGRWASPSEIGPQLTAAWRQVDWLGTNSSTAR